MMIPALVGLTLAWTWGAVGQQSPNAAAKPVYENNFQNAAVDTVPEDFLVLEGAFAVKEADGNRFLQLPGAPLDSFGVLFGPTELSGFTVSARIFGTSKGRRYPAFAVGLNGVGGVRLQVSPAKKLLELYKAEEVIASVPYDWDTDSWTWLQLRVRKSSDDTFIVEGKAWKHGTPEPAARTLMHSLQESLVAGRASVWGKPFSGTPIRFDDFVLAPAP